jgi:hypothetical protein
MCKHARQHKYNDNHFGQKKGETVKLEVLTGKDTERS